MNPSALKRVGDEANAGQCAAFRRRRRSQTFLLIWLFTDTMKQHRYLIRKFFANNNNRGYLNWLLDTDSDK